jgi:uncharacterized membrane protein
MGHHHARHAAPDTRRMQRLALAVVAPVALLTLVGLILLWPAGDALDGSGAGAEEFGARVVAVHPEECAEELSQDVNGCGTTTVELTEGPDAEQQVEVPLPNGPGAPVISEGDQVLVIATSGPDGEAYSIVDHQRSTQLWILCLAFVLALLAFGRWRGLTALVGLAVTFAVLLWFVVPAILAGESPILVAVVGSAAIALTVLYLTHGLTLSTTVAVLGTLASLALTGALAVVSVWALHLTGVTDDISTSVEMTHGVDMAGLLVASIIIGSLGVLDDVTVTQAATVAELAHANPAYRFGQLNAAASRVGRSHIASVVNTIILAYAGSSLPLLILIIADNSSLGGVVTTQLMAQEIVRSAVATLGLIAAVPMTTALAALAVRGARPRATEPSASPVSSA